MLFPLISDLKSHIWWWQSHKLDSAWIAELLLRGELPNNQDYLVWNLSKSETLTSWVTITWGFFYYSSENHPNITLNSFLVICWISPSLQGLGSCIVLPSCLLGLRAFPWPPAGWRESSYLLSLCSTRIWPARNLSLWISSSMDWAALADMVSQCCFLPF